jgi:DNA-binding MarR family transcriptional regulator
MNSAAVTALILETFRLNGRLLAAGDDLVRGLDLTSARWQVLGAVAAAPIPLSVAQVARSMGLTRQAVQRLANEMERDGLLRFAANPNHRRAKLVVLTPRGQSAYGAAMKRQHPWAQALAQGLTVQQVSAATLVLKRLRQRLERDETAEGE